MSNETYPERAARHIRAWPQWSRAERRRMEEIVEDVLDHLQNGTGNPFIAAYCRLHLLPALAKETAR